MLLAIDIGNTNVTCGLFRKNKLIRRFVFSTKQAKYYGALKKHLASHELDGAIVSSVVPKATTRLELALRFLKVKNVLILGKDILVPIKNLYQYPRQVGQDRLVNGYAATRLYGCPAIVVDFGTAITFDIISARKEYRGGLILPGLETSLSALSEKAALLPKIALSKPPKSLIGRNTKDSMLSGIIFGFASLTDSLIQELKDSLPGKQVKVIGTGGNISFISKYCHNFDFIDQDLTLKGLNLTFPTLTTPGGG